MNRPQPSRVACQHTEVDGSGAASKTDESDNQSVTDIKQCYASSSTESRCQHRRCRCQTTGVSIKQAKSNTSVNRRQSDATCQEADECWHTCHEQCQCGAYNRQTTDRRPETVTHANEKRLQGQSQCVHCNDERKSTTKSCDNIANSTISITCSCHSNTIPKHADGTVDNECSSCTSRSNFRYAMSNPLSNDCIAQHFQSRRRHLSSTKSCEEADNDRPRVCGLHHSGTAPSFPQRQAGYGQRRTSSGYQINGSRGPDEFFECGQNEILSNEFESAGAQTVETYSSTYAQVGNYEEQRCCVRKCTRRTQLVIMILAISNVIQLMINVGWLPFIYMSFVRDCDPCPEPSTTPLPFVPGCARYKDLIDVKTGKQLFDNSLYFKNKEGQTCLNIGSGVNAIMQKCEEKLVKAKKDIEEYDKNKKKHEEKKQVPIIHLESEKITTINERVRLEWILSKSKDMHTTPPSADVLSGLRTEVKIPADGIYFIYSQVHVFISDADVGKKHTFSQSLVAVKDNRPIHIDKIRETWRAANATGKISKLGTLVHLLEGDLVYIEVKTLDKSIISNTEDKHSLLFVHIQ